ncbi:hypothetical protein JK358_35420 [Nocardia sp. 2]|uniref:Cyclic nucleotide-binding domain-containing protein n=1 Tax=Nocardia acididurans TaxID=2802282 RepID=A0ABS1MGB1_9NOCA|nr:hypothetical protein [Nocardia acididurans]MBL1079708.1 hypothetical protein [Nocardia acididurans]
MEIVTASDLRRLLAADDNAAYLVLVEGRVDVVPSGDAPGLVLIDRAQVVDRIGSDPDPTALNEFAALLDSEIRLQGG